MQQGSNLPHTAVYLRSDSFLTAFFAMKTWNWASFCYFNYTFFQESFIFACRVLHNLDFAQAWQGDSFLSHAKI